MALCEKGYARNGDKMDFTGTLINEYNSLPSFWWPWLIVLAGVVWFIDGMKMTSGPLLTVYVVFILFETIIGRKPSVIRAELFPFWSYSHPELRMEIALNYILFIPLGIFALFVLWREVWTPSGFSRFPAFDFD